LLYLAIACLRAEATKGAQHVAQGHLTFGSLEDGVDPSPRHILFIIIQNKAASTAAHLFNHLVPRVGVVGPNKHLGAAVVHLCGITPGTSVLLLGVARPELYLGRLRK